MARRDMTQMGGPNESFPPTVWQDIAAIQGPDAQQRGEALNRVVAVYWKPVYTFLRHRGYDNDAAKDLTQGFFTDVVIKRDLLRQAQQSKGKLRTFVLSSLRNYEIDVFRNRRAKAPPGGMRNVDDTQLAGQEPSDDMTPDGAFYRAYAERLFSEVLAEVEAECRSNQQAIHWLLFHARYVQPVLGDGVTPDLSQLAAEHGIKDSAQASNMMITVKRRFTAALRRHVRQLETREADVDQEMRDLMHALIDAAGVNPARRMF